MGEEEGLTWVECAQRIGLSNSCRRKICVVELGKALVEVLVMNSECNPHLILFMPSPTPNVKTH
jgi:hypothetical protein